MRTTLYRSLIAVLLCLPCLRAQSLATEYEMLKKRHQAAVEAFIAPIDKKFTADADAIGARALKQSDPIYETIKAIRVPATLSELLTPKSTPFDDSYWKLTTGDNYSMYHLEAGGLIEQVTYDINTKKRGTTRGRWEPVNSTHASAGKYILRIGDSGTLSRGDGLKWERSDKETYEKYSKAKDFQAADSAIRGLDPVAATDPPADPTMPAAEPAAPPETPATPFGGEETPFGTK